MLGPSPPAALQMGMPGGVELFIILVIAVIVFGLPILIITVVGLAWLRGDGDDYDERIAELETEIARLQAEVGADAGTDGATSEAEAGSPDSGLGDAGDSATDGGGKSAGS